MKEFLKKLRDGYILIFIGILFLGFLLRFNNFDHIPRHGATFDEFAWTWLGVNLINEHKPISWSSQPQYENKKHLIYQGAAFWIVYPYLEHPPFFGLISGSAAIINGAKDMYDVTLAKIRPLALLLGTLSIVMIFVLTNELYGRKVGLLAALLYSTIPTIVIGSRIVQNENFFIPFWLLALFFTVKYLKTKKKILRNLAAVICMLLVLAKVPWIAASLSIVLILAYKRKYKDAVLFFSAPLLGLLLFFMYGLYFDKDLFIGLWGLQIARYDLSFSSFFAIFTKPYLVDRFYLDGWIYFGWFSIFLLFQNVKKNFLTIFAVMSYFLIFIAGIPDEPGHGWYRYPFYPFLIISIALFIKEYFTKNQILTFIFLVIVGSALFQNTWAEFFGFSYLVYRIIIILWMLTGIGLLIPNRRVVKLSNLLSYFWLLVLVLLNIWSVTIFNDM